jgi:Sigma-70, region 4
VRTIERRRAREQEAAAMNELLTHESDATWEHIAPHLDAALGELSEADRDALMLRYFERKSAQEMAQVLGITHEAAQKRVTRAVERLRELFAQRGVTVGASGLAVVISANAVQAAPFGLAVTISTAATLAGTTVATTATAAATKAIAMTALKNTLTNTVLVAAALLLAGGGLAVLVLLTRHLYAPRTPQATQTAVSTSASISFSPMAGEWEGTWALRGDGARGTRRQRVVLTIEALGDGRACRIRMQWLDRNDQPTNHWRLEHALNAAGDRIHTTQDGGPGPSVLDGEVIDAFHDQTTGEWRLGFRATLAGIERSIECRWERVRDELFIHQEDVANVADGQQTQFVEISLRPRSNKPRTAVSALPRGEQTFDGVRFVVERPINIIGARAARAKGRAPARVADSSVQGRGRHIHVLHTGDHGSSVTGDYIWRLVLHYADGAREFFDFSYDVHLRNFWRRTGDGPPAPTDPDSTLAWVGTSQESDRSGAELVLTRTSIRNPRPATAVTGAEYVSLFGSSSAYVLGVTVSDEGPVPGAAERPSAPRIVPITLRLMDPEGRLQPDTSVELEYHGDDFMARPATFLAEPDGRVRLFAPAGTVRSILYTVLTAEGRFASGLIEVDPDVVTTLEEDIILRADGVVGPLKDSRAAQVR